MSVSLLTTELCFPPARDSLSPASAYRGAVGQTERQALRLLAAGLSSTEVAEEMVISVSTARSYIKSIYGEIYVHGREKAIERSQQVGLI